MARSTTLPVQGWGGTRVEEDGVSYCDVCTEREPRHVHYPDLPKLTPWGVETVHCLLREGVWQVSTEGHGGIRVDSLYAALLSSYAKEHGIAYDGGWWYEEDCDWVLVAAEQPEWLVSPSWPIPVNLRRYALRVIGDLYPDSPLLVEEYLGC